MHPSAPSVNSTQPRPSGAPPALPGPVHPPKMIEDDSMPLYPQPYPSAKVVNTEMHPSAPSVNSTQPRPSGAPPALPGPVHPPPLLLGPENTVTSCPFCAASIKTAVKYTTTTGTHIAASHCSLTCCCCLMYLCDSAKNVDHYCPNCQRYLGTYRK